MTCEECLLRQLAAFVDGEGSIRVQRFTVRREVNRRLKAYLGYAQQLDIANTDFRLIEWLLENFGGKIPNPKKTKDNQKGVYHWSLSGSNSYALLKKIRPYLLLKQEQADCAIELWEKVSKWNYGGNKPMPKHKRELAETLYQRCKKLNIRGLKGGNNKCR